MKAIRLQCEYLNNPIGIDIPRPRLMWNAEGGVRQTAYQIVSDNWDSGKVESASMHADYPKELHDRERVNWRIRLWDENGQSGQWSEAFFERGISAWDAKWITGNYGVKRKKRYPVDCFRRAFEVRESVKSARLYITACGLYEAKISGALVGDFAMAPGYTGYTDYRKRVQYQTYDVTSMLHTGENEITVQLADGWYRGSCGAWGLRNQYGAQTKLLAQLEITYEDGSRDTIVTDKRWQWSNDGAIRFADNKDGEVIEAFREPSYSGHAKVTKHSVLPSCSNNVPVKAHESFKPTLITTPSGKRVLDFGQNIAGWIAFSLEAEKGQRVFLRMGEMLGSDGEFTQKNIQLSRKNKTTPLQQVEYICKDGRNDYRTTFAVFGFQYALIETDVEFRPEDFTAIAVYSDFERTGYFDCSDELVNQFFEATVWSAKGNHLDIPTDCPTRERHGWTGDAQIFFNTASYIFNFAPFAKKYLHDVFDWQEKSGRLPHIAPDGGADFYMRSMNGSVGWSDVGILMPWRYSKKYGDDRILAEFYDGMSRYARFMEKRCGKNMPIFAEHIRLKGEAKKYLVNTGQSYGEWAEPADVCAFRWQDFAAPHPEVSTAYTSHVLGLMSSAAEKQGRTGDAAEYKKYSDGCKLAYQALVRTDKYTLDTDRQAQLVRPLYFGLLDEEQSKFAKKRLLEALSHYGWRLGTGFLSTPLILYVLADYDTEAAYRLLENEKIPGWLSMPKAGATTIWEAWEGPNSSQGGIGSLNHYSKGAVCEWLFDTMCGIHVDGENHFTVTPLPGGRFTRAQASYNSVYGKIESKWEKKDGSVIYTVTVPANCEATVLLPSGRSEKVAAGTFTFTEE